MRRLYCPLDLKDVYNKKYYATLMRTLGYSSLSSILSQQFLSFEDQAVILIRISSMRSGTP